MAVALEDDAAGVGPRRKSLVPSKADGGVPCRGGFVLRCRARARVGRGRANEPCRVMVAFEVEYVRVGELGDDVSVRRIAFLTALS